MVTAFVIVLGLLALAGLVCQVMILIRAFRISVRWGLLFLIGPLIVGPLAILTAIAGLAGGPLIVLLAYVGAHIYFFVKHWDKVRGPALAWLGCGVTAFAFIGIMGALGLTPRQAITRMRNPEVPPAVDSTGPSDTHLYVDGGRIWYKVSGSGSGVPVILLHGGPGVPSYSMKPLEALGDDRPVVRYDQLGAGRSERTSDTTLFNIAHFVGELDSLRTSLGYDKVHLVGHSWGTILGVEYYRAHPDRVASLTLASPVLSAPEWERNARRLVATLSDSAQVAIRARETLFDYDAPDYLSAVSEYSGRYVALRPVEDDRDSTVKGMNPQLYNYLWGPSEFTIKGKLRSYDATSRLRSIRVPTLYTVGEFDQANPATVKRFAAMTPGARVEVIPNAAHITTWDNPDVMIGVVRDFMRAADSAAVKP